MSTLAYCRRYGPVATHIVAPGYGGPALADHTPCCTSHNIKMCCTHYRETHFVEVGNCCAADAERRPEAAIL